MTYFLCYLAGLATGFVGMALFAGGHVSDVYDAIRKHRENNNE